MLNLENSEKCKNNFPVPCTNLAIAGGYCALHQNKLRRQNIRNYNLGKWQAQLESQGGENVKNLREEIGILRIMVQEIFDKCGDDSNKLLLHSPQISNLINNIRDTVINCHKLETQLGAYLDKSQAITLVEGILAILNKYVDEDDRDLVANEILELVASNKPVPVE